MRLNPNRQKTVHRRVAAFVTFTVFLSIICFNNVTRAVLNHQPETLLPLIPVMTSSMQNGIKLTSSVPDPYNILKQSFDGRADTYCNMTPPSWIQVELPNPVTLRYYSITNNSYDTRSPRTWTLVGSNDGSLWIPLDDRNDPVESSFFIVRGESRVFQIPANNCQQLKYYRLNLIRGYDDGRSSILLADFQLYSTPAAAPPEETITPVIPGMARSFQNGIKLTSSFPDPYNILKQSFDGRADTYCNFMPPGFIQVEFPSPQAIRYYSITNNNYDTRSPRTWTLLGSNDGSLWIPLDQRDDPIESSFFVVRGQTRVFQTTANDIRLYKYYRLTIIRSYDDGCSGILLGDFQLYSTSTAPQPEETLTSIIPVMASSIQDGIKLTSSFPDPYNILKQSFDGRADTCFNLTPPGFIQVEFPIPQTLHYYSITNNSYDSRSPRTWTLLGSNDGVFWLPLDEQDDPVSSSFFVMKGEKRVYQIPAAKINRYKYYRLKLIRGYDDGRAGILLGDFQAYVDTNSPSAASQPPETVNPLIPVMDGPVQAGVKLSSSTPDPYNTLKDAFDGRADTYFNFTPPGFVQMEFEAPVEVRYYSITNNSYDSRAPRTWTLLGSKDRKLWFPLDEQNDSVESSFYVIRGETRFFQIPTPQRGSFNYYRLQPVRGYDDGRSSILLGDFQIYANQNPTTPLETMFPLIPVMNGPLQNGIKISSSIADPSNTLKSSFDGRADTFYNVTPPGWVQVEFPSPTLVHYYSITNNSLDTRSPRTWVFLGSNDGNLWLPLDERENPVESSYFVMRGETRIFQIPEDNLSGFKYYRLKLVRGYDDGQNGILLGDFQIYQTQCPPILDPIGNQTVAEGEWLQFTVTANDPNGDPLTYSATGLPYGAVLDPATGSFRWIPDYMQAGGPSPTVTFTVSDGTYQVSETISITVTDAEPVQLLPDPNFDDGLEKWNCVYKDASAQITTGCDYSDYDSAPCSYKIECIKNGDSPSSIQLFVMPIHIVKDYRYQLSFKAKCGTRFSIPSINLMKATSPWSQYATPCSGPTITNDWQAYTVIFTANTTAADGRINFFLGAALPEGSIIHIDSVSLKEIVVYPPPGVELLPNPGFDLGTGNWSFYHDSSAQATGCLDSTNYDSAPVSYRIQCIDNGTTLNSIQLFTMPIQIDKDKSYRFTFKAKSSSGFTIPSIRLMKATSPWTNYAAPCSGVAMNDTAWQNFSLVFTANTTATDGRITFFFGNALPDGATFWIDTLSLQEIIQ